MKPFLPGCAVVFALCLAAISRPVHATDECSDIINDDESRKTSEAKKNDRPVTWPIGRKLEGVMAKDVHPEPPRSEDYDAKLKSGSRYEIIKNLPAVTKATPTDFIDKGTSSAIRTKDGSWKIIGGGLIPDEVAKRLEALYEAVRSRFGNEAVLGDIELRRYSKPPRGPAIFHVDLGLPTHILLDSWNGDKTYVQGVNGNIFQAGENEAVLLAAGKNGGLHAFPASNTREYDVNRILVRFVIMGKPQ